MATTFFEYFRGQEAWWGAAYLIPAAVAYVLIAALIAALIARVDRGRAARLAIATSATLGLFLVALAFFDGAALYVRDIARLDSYYEFVRLAKIAFVALYVAFVGVAVVFGRLIGRAWRVGIATGVTTVGFLAVTFRWVEFLNACFIGEPVLWPSYIEC